jgi:hypothetical protein
MLDPEFVAAAETARAELRESRVGPFPDELRERVYRYYLTEIRHRNTEIPVALSTESLAMWERLGADLGMNPANYVCGCGAAATPGRRALDTNPWDDARSARTWDGLSAEPEG